MMTSTRRWLVALVALGLAIYATVASAAGGHPHPRAAQVTTATYNPKLRPPASKRLHAALLSNSMPQGRATPMRG